MRRPLRPLITLAVFALIVAGCSNASAGSGSRGGDGTAATAGGAGSGAAHEKAVAFAQCMPANGISAFPDPDATGEVTIEGIANGSSVDTSSGAFTQAFERVQGPGAVGVRGQIGAGGSYAAPLGLVAPSPWSSKYVSRAKVSSTSSGRPKPPPASSETNPWRAARMMRVA